MQGFQGLAHTSRRRTLVRIAALVMAGTMSLVGTSAAVAADARSQLDAFVKQVRSATGTFTQSTQSSRGQPAPAHLLDEGVELGPSVGGHGSRRPHQGDRKSVV